MAVCLLLCVCVCVWDCVFLVASVSVCWFRCSSAQCTRELTVEVRQGTLPSGTRSGGEDCRTDLAVEVRRRRASRARQLT